MMGWSVSVTAVLSHPEHASDELAYEQGLIARRGSFEETKQYAYVNPYAQQYAGREDFSELIRRR